VNSIPKPPEMEIYVKISLISYFPIFSFFLVYNHDFVMYIDITHVAVSNTATDDDRIYVTHRIFTANL